MQCFLSFRYSLLVMFSVSRILGTVISGLLYSSMNVGVRFIQSLFPSMMLKFILDTPLVLMVVYYHRNLIIVYSVLVTRLFSLNLLLLRYNCSQ